MLRSALSEAESVCLASLTICMMLAVAQKPFSEAEFMKKCFLSTAKTLFSNYHNKIDILRAIDSMQISHNQFKGELFYYQTILFLKFRRLYQILLRFLSLSTKQQILQIYHSFASGFDQLMKISRLQQTLTIKAIHGQTRGTDIYFQ